MSVVENSVDKYRISIARGRLIKDYLWRKIEVGTLYYSQKSRLTTPPILLPVNIKTSSTYSNPSSHVTLCFASALRCKNLVVSSGTGAVLNDNDFDKTCTLYSISVFLNRKFILNNTRRKEE